MGGEKMNVLQVVEICVAVYAVLVGICVLVILFALRRRDKRLRQQAQLDEKLQRAPTEETVFRGRAEENKENPYTVTLDESRMSDDLQDAVP